MLSRVYVEITNLCNRSCSFCPKTKRTPKIMTPAEFDLVTDRLQGVTGYIYLHVMGEPLTHPHLAEMIAIGSKKGFKIAITTNGSLLSAMQDVLLSSSVYKVNISVHSFERDEPEKHLEYVESCLNFADKASEKGILTVLRLWNEGFAPEHNQRVERALLEKFGAFESVSARGVRIRNRLHLEYGKRFDWPDLSADTRSDSVFCYGLLDHFGILADGTVIPCCLDHEGDIPLGNIFTHSVGEILSSERAVALKNGFARKTAVEPLCKKCGYARRFRV